MVDAQLNINLFDGLVYLTLFLAGFISLYRGFIREFLSIITWFGAGLITLGMADNAIAYVRQFMTSDLGAAMVGVMGTYFISVTILGMLTRMVMKYVKQGSDVGFLDNALGLLFGLLKGGMIIILGFILMTLVFKEEGYPEWIQQAHTLPTVQRATISVVRLMPEYLGTISSLGAAQEEEPVPDDAAPTPETVNEGIEDELFRRNLSKEEIEQGTGALEQLIMDVTKDREDQGDF